MDTVTTSVPASRPSHETRELQQQLNTSRAENQDLQKKYDALLHRYKSADEERKALAIEFEMTRVEASDQKEYYSKWQATQAELDASKRQLEALQKEAKKESHRMWELIEASHQQTIKDKQTIRAQKAELKLLKGDGGSKASTPDKASRVKAAIRDVNKENTGEEAENAEPARTAVKRKYDDLLNDPTDAGPDVKVARHTSPLTDLEAQFGPGDATRQPLSQTSMHNSPASSRIKRNANPRSVIEHVATLPKHQEVTTRILAQESQSVSQNQETEETVPLDFDDEDAESKEVHRPQLDRKPIINLHDKTTSRPLVSPETETAPLIVAKASTDRRDHGRKAHERKLVPNLHDKTTSRPLVSPETETAGYFNESRGKAETAAQRSKIDGQKAQPEKPDDNQSNAAKTGKTSQVDSKAPKSDRALRSGQKRDPSPIKTEARPVKHETPVAALRRSVKQETPLRNADLSRSSTPGTGTKDRPLLPIPGWKGGKKSARAFVRKDSFEDDGFGEQTSNQGNTLIRKREQLTQANTPARGVESAGPSNRSKTTAPKAKHSAIPGYMSTEMKRSRTTGDASSTRGLTNIRSSPAPETVDVKMHSDPVYERSATTPLRDRNRNVGLGSSRASPALSVEGKKHERKVSTSKLREGDELERGTINDAGQGGKDGLSTSKPAGGERYEINPDRNKGLTYAYQNVERRKEERKKMAGHGCLECENYYNAVGEMPVSKRGPVWRSPSPESKRRESRRAGKCPHGKDVGDDGDDGGDGGDGGDDEMEDEDAKQRLMNQISRHRDDWKGPTTPPQYWDIRFPNTQDVEEINKQAEIQREAKRAEMKREADKKDGKYRRVGG